MRDKSGPVKIGSGEQWGRRVICINEKRITKGVNEPIRWTNRNFDKREIPPGRVLDELIGNCPTNTQTLADDT